jgi:hypothetical protein
MLETVYAIASKRTEFARAIKACSRPAMRTKNESPGTVA